MNQLVFHEMSRTGFDPKPQFRHLDFSGISLLIVPQDHQAFQVPKMDLLTYKSCMDTVRLKGNPTPPK